MYENCTATIVVTVYQTCSYYVTDIYDQHPFDCSISNTVDVFYDCPAPDPSGGGGSGSTPPPPCTPPTGGPVDDAIRDNEKVQVYAPPPPVDPGGGIIVPPPLLPCPPQVTPPPTVTITITNKVKNPCLQKMVEKAILSGVDNKINSLIKNVFGGSTKMNLTFIDINTLGSNIDGYTELNGGVINGNLNVEIQLDQNHLPNYSQEYIARVIMHEALHAYLTSIGTDISQQHESMIVSYVTQMAGALKQMFPTLSDEDAKNLSLGGLQLSPTFINTIKNDMALSGTFDATNMSYAIGSKGTRCN